MPGAQKDISIWLMIFLAENEKKKEKVSPGLINLHFFSVINGRLTKFIF